MLQYIDFDSLKADFLRENRNQIPSELMAYATMWEDSASHFFDLFLGFLERRGLEISFKHPLASLPYDQP